MKASHHRTGAHAGRVRFALPLAVALVLAAAAPIAGQQDSTSGAQKGELLAWIVAIVGDSIVTRGDIDEGVAVWEAQNNRQLAGEQRQQLAEQVLENRINELLLLQAAQRDTTIVVEDADVQRAVDQQIAQVRQQYQQRFGNAAAFDEALRSQQLTMQEYRESLAIRARRDMYIGQFRQKLRRDRKPPPVTDEEIRALFDEAAASGQVPMVPPSITFEQVVVPVEPSEEALAVARAKADSVRQLVLEDPDNFAQLARRFSEDPGSRELGGDLGWFRPGSGLVQEFEMAAYRLRPGEISPLVLTYAGYHIIKVERARGPERQASHILIRPATTEADIERTRVRADSVLGMLRSGVRADSLRTRFGDETEPTRVGPWPRDSLEGGYASALQQASPGDYVGPFRLEGGPIVKWGVAHVIATEDARPATVADYRDYLQQTIASNKLMEEILAELRRRMYVEIRQPPGGSGGG